jgi:predicted TIM-barrel fold metal-dependent hydrolase
MANPERRLWIDTHTHLLRCSVPDGSALEYSLADVLAVLDRCDADLRFVCNDNNPHDVARVAEEPEHLRRMNERVYRQFVAQAQGRLLGSVNIDPRAVRQSQEEMDLYIGERGYVQVGEVEGLPFGFDLDSPQMVELARHAAALGAPVQLHCSTSEDPSGEHIRQALHLAALVPQGKFILAHAIGGRNTYQYVLAVEQYLARGLDNVYLEVVLFNVRKYLRAAYEHLGAERLIVGTDWATYHGPPFAPYGTHLTLMAHPDWWRTAQLKGFSQWGSQLWLSSQLVLDLEENPYPCAVSSLVWFMREAGLSEEDIDKIACGNAISLFGLREKGLI